MSQLPLFPLPGAPKTPLPHESLREARDLLAELLVVLLESTSEEVHVSDGEKADE